MIIVLGRGDKEIVVVKQDERVGLLIQHLDEQHPVGAFVGSVGQQYQPEDADVLIWLDGLDSARVLQDTVNHAVLQKQGIALPN